MQIAYECSAFTDAEGASLNGNCPWIVRKERTLYAGSFK